LQIKGSFQLVWPPIQAFKADIQLEHKQLDPMLKVAVRMINALIMAE